MVMKINKAWKVLAIFGALVVLLGCAPLNWARGVLGDLGDAYCKRPLRVTKTEDTNDGQCFPDDCSLREAVIAANQCEGRQNILIDEYVTYELTIEGEGEDDARTGDLDIRGVVGIFKYWPIIDTPTPATPATIDAGGLDRIFDIHSGELTSDNLILVNGSADIGGGMRIAAGAEVIMPYLSLMDHEAERDGGAIYNAGLVRVGRQIQISRNDASRGGAIFNKGQLELDGCEIYNNAANQGALFNDTAGDVEFSGCSIRENTGTGVVNRGEFNFLLGDIVDHVGEGSGGVVSQGVALFNEPEAEADLDTVTLNGNRSEGPGAAVILNLGQLSLHNVTMVANQPVDIGISNPGDGMTGIENSILAFNGEKDCHGSFNSRGGNLVAESGCGFDPGLGDVLETEPGSLGLLPGGGRPRSFPLAEDSPAVDNGTDSCYEEDIRGISRPLDGDGNGTEVCDSGSSEYQPLEPTSLIYTATVESSPSNEEPAAPPLPPPTVGEDTLCWAGPGPEYGTVSSLQAGEEVDLVGVGEDEGWRVIDNPRYPGVSCWVPEIDLEVDPELDLSDLTVVPVPVLPTATPEPIQGCLYQGPNDNQPSCYPIDQCPVPFDQSQGACTP